MEELNWIIIRNRYMPYFELIIVYSIFMCGGIICIFISRGATIPLIICFVVYGSVIFVSAIPMRIVFDIAEKYAISENKIIINKVFEETPIVIDLKKIDFIYIEKRLVEIFYEGKKASFYVYIDMSTLEPIVELKKKLKK